MSLLKTLRSHATKERAVSNRRFFKTSKGQYGEGDVFWGITVPDIRKVVKEFRDISDKDIELLLRSKVHEVRLCGVLILVGRCKKEPEKMFRLYYRNRKYINNWDMVDSSAGYVIGGYLFDKDKALLQKMAKSKNIWERRMAIIATFYFIMKGEVKETLHIAKILLHDPHDLIHKAVGWMLREAEKKGSIREVRKFLDEHAGVMPRTMLRYAIERFGVEDRKRYLAMKGKGNL